MRKRVLPPEDTLSANSSAAAAVGCSTPPSTPRNTVTATGAAIRPTIGGSGNIAKCAVRIWSASAAARNSRPNVQMPAIAAMPVGKKTIENVLRMPQVLKMSTSFFVPSQGLLKIRYRHPVLDFTRNGISGSKWPTEKAGRAAGRNSQIFACQLARSKSAERCGSPAATSKGHWPFEAPTEPTGETSSLQGSRVKPLPSDMMLCVI